MPPVSSLAVVVVYGALLSFVAVRARTARHYSEFSLARRALPLALVFGSLAATYVGPAFSSGFVGKGFECGWLFLGIGGRKTAEDHCQRKRTAGQRKVGVLTGGLCAHSNKREQRPVSYNNSHRRNRQHGVNPNSRSRLKIKVQSAKLRTSSAEGGFHYFDF